MTTALSLQSFVARYGLQARLDLVPWEQLPAPLRLACDEILAAWWDHLDPDQPIQAAGLLDMTVAQLLAAWRSQRQHPPHPEASGLLQRRFRVVSYLRVEPEEALPISLDEALAELEQLQLLSPESVHRVEEVCQVIVASNDPQPKG